MARYALFVEAVGLYNLGIKFRVYRGYTKHANCFNYDAIASPQKGLATIYSATEGA